MKRKWTRRDLDESDESPAENEVREAYSGQEREARRNDSSNEGSTGKEVLGTEPLSQHPSGQRRHYKTQEEGRRHQGLDLLVPHKLTVLDKDQSYDEDE